MHEGVHAQILFWKSKTNPQSFSVFVKKLSDKEQEKKLFLQSSKVQKVRNIRHASLSTDENRKHFENI